MLNWVNTLNYNAGFGGHNLNFMLGNEALKNSTVSHSSSDSQYEDQEEIFRYLGIGLNEMKGASEGYSAWALLSTFGRAEYNYTNKYLVSANIRRDGSSRFSEDLKYGIFYSGSLGWRIDKEDFFDLLSEKISMLKLRVSAGQLGNQEIGVYPTASTFGSGYNYVFGGGNSQDLVLGYAAEDRGNDKIKWETTTQYDAGLDARFFKNKLSLTADYFLKITDDMLVKAPVSAIGGSAEAPFVNAGSVRNHGLELELRYQDRKGQLAYNIESNFSFINNKVVSLGTDIPIRGGEIDSGTFAARTIPGQPIGAFYMLEMEGIFQNDAEVFSSPNQGNIVGPGDVKYVDQDNNFIIDEKDRVYVGSPIPKFTYGLIADLNYKNFDFTMFFQGVYGNKIYMQIGKDIEGFYRNLNITKRYANEHWRPDYPSNIMPRASWYASTNNIQPSTRFLFDGSYLRLKNAQLGYTLPKSFSQRINIQRLRIYISGHNLLTFSNYIGMDPELTTSANDASERDLASGIDWGTYPSSITYTIGLNLTF
jgi:TonB-linked SusC/RagA family outer membrane protein